MGDKEEGPLCMFIFGASGDLSMRMLFPALATLTHSGELHKSTKVYGVARSSYSDESFRKRIAEGLEKFVKGEQNHSDFLERVYYIQGDYGAEETYRTIAEKLGEENYSGALFYLSTPPFVYEKVAKGVADLELSKDRVSWARFVIEKPFGEDFESARKLNFFLHERYREEQLYRIDHYIAKETILNIFTLRWGNTIWEPIWNRNYISHVDICVSEELDVASRTGYYDSATVIRDMMQNHLLQMLAIVAMEPPTIMEPKALRDEKMKVLHAVRTITVDDAILGQYYGYRQHEGVEPDTTTPTFAMLRVFVDNWRWQGVPFFLSSGKQMEKKASVIKLFFKEVPHQIFGANTVKHPNVLKIIVQPNESIVLHQHVKLPGKGLQTRVTSMRFSYPEKFGPDALQGAYERVLFDVIKGDQSFFPRNDEIEKSWKIVGPLLDLHIEPVIYAKGLSTKAGEAKRGVRGVLLKNEFPEPIDLVNSSTETITRIIIEAIKQRGTCSIALAGGQTPRPIYSLLATAPYLSRFDPNLVHFFFTDEKCVPPDHHDSNYLMAKEALIDHIDIQSENVHRIKGEISAEAAAKEYSLEILSVLGTDPVFDLVILGMGEDGHVASLFPGSPCAIDSHDFVVGHFIPQVDASRVTLTPRLINSARNILFLVTDPKKASLLRMVENGPICPCLLPAQSIAPKCGKLFWNVSLTK